MIIKFTFCLNETAFEVHLVHESFSDISLNRRCSPVTETELNHVKIIDFILDFYWSITKFCSSLNGKKIFAQKPVFMIMIINFNNNK